ncbi:hypothetical protein [Streptosporangium sp. KLBMP 9127]|nr:hypothetical protein [Streptosporangium sp. KLBMP 9127]
MIKTATKVAIAATLAAGALMANPAHAVAAAYTPEGVCGAGFSKVKDGTRAVKSGKDLYGHVYLLYNRRTGYNCATLIKTAFRRTATTTSVTLQVEGQKPKSDTGRFKYYAGPVKLKADGDCVRYSGYTTDTRIDQAHASGGRKTYGNCK